MDQYIAMIIAILPSIINILSTIAVFFKLVNNFKSSLNTKTNELEELKNQYKVILQENNIPPVGLEPTVNTLSRCRFPGISRVFHH